MLATLTGAASAKSGAAEKAADAPGQANATTAPGNSENAPGQAKKAEATADVAVVAKAKPEDKGKSATAPGRTKADKEPANPAKGKSAAAKAKTKPATVTTQNEPNLGRSAEAHRHVIICHATGSATNPFVVINIPMIAWTEAHDVHQDGRDFILKDPASRPGSKDGFTKASCGQPALPAQQSLNEEAVQAAVVTEQAAGEVLGVQKALTKPAKAQGGVLGALGSVASDELPFTGLPLWIAALIGMALVSAGLGARKAMR